MPSHYKIKQHTIPETVAPEDLSHTMPKGGVPPSLVNGDVRKGLVASYSGAELERLAQDNAPARDARKQGLTVPTVDTAKGGKIVFLPGKPRGKTPGTPPRTGAKNTIEFIRPFAPEQPEAMAALAGLRANVRRILIEHGVDPREPASLAQMTGAAILDRAVVMAAKSHSSAVRSAAERGTLASHIARTQPTTYVVPVTSKGSTLAFIRPEKSAAPTRVALRVASPEISKEASAAAQSLGEIDNQSVPEYGGLIELATCDSIIPKTARRPLETALVHSGLDFEPVTYNPVPEFQQGAAPAQ